MILSISRREAAYAGRENSVSRYFTIFLQSLHRVRPIKPHVSVRSIALCALLMSGLIDSFNCSHTRISRRSFVTSFVVDRLCDNRHFRKNSSSAGLLNDGNLRDLR